MCINAYHFNKDTFTIGVEPFSAWPSGYEYTTFLRKSQPQLVTILCCVCYVITKSHTVIHIRIKKRENRAGNLKWLCNSIITYFCCL